MTGCIRANAIAKGLQKHRRRRSGTKGELKYIKWNWKAGNAGRTQLDQGFHACSVQDGCLGEYCLRHLPRGTFNMAHQTRPSFHLRDFVIAKLPLTMELRVSYISAGCHRCLRREAVEGPWSYGMRTFAVVLTLRWWSHEVADEVWSRRQNTRQWNIFAWVLTGMCSGSAQLTVRLFRREEYYDDCCHKRSSATRFHPLLIGITTRELIPAALFLQS